jgi:hypothetical protein
MLGTAKQREPRRRDQRAEGQGGRSAQDCNDAGDADSGNGHGDLDDNTYSVEIEEDGKTFALDLSDVLLNSGPPFVEELGKGV